MAKPTQQEILIAGLKRMLCKQVPSRSGKYTQFTSPWLPNKFVFVGKAGALRHGRTSTESRSVNPNARRIVMEKGREALGLVPPDNSNVSLEDLGI